MSLVPPLHLGNRATLQPHGCSTSLIGSALEKRASAERHSDSVGEAYG